jgi:hypothetical protein
MAKRKNKQVIAGLEKGGLISSMIKQFKTGKERLKEIYLGMYEWYSMQKVNPERKREPMLEKPKKFDLKQFNNN